MQCQLPPIYNWPFYDHHKKPQPITLVRLSFTTRHSLAGTGDLFPKAGLKIVIWCPTPIPPFFQGEEAFYKQQVADPGVSILFPEVLDDRRG